MSLSSEKTRSAAAELGVNERTMRMARAHLPTIESARTLRGGSARSGEEVNAQGKKRTLAREKPSTLARWVGSSAHVGKSLPWLFQKSSTPAVERVDVRVVKRRTRGD